jgi:Holliday junction resolvase RusA-like endonuclease
MRDRTLKITIPGPPIAKKRPRFYRRGSFVGTYNPQETEEGRWLLTARSQFPQEKLFGPLTLDIFFYMPIPKGSLKKIQSMNQTPHVKTPDVDNCIKFVLDCLNGELWEDDRQVWKINARKVYAINPETVIFVN